MKACQVKPYVLLSVPTQMLLSPQSALTDTSRIIFNQMYGNYMVQLSLHIKLTITNSNYSFYFPVYAIHHSVLCFWCLI